MELDPPALIDPDIDVSVTCHAGRWFLSRGDFRAEWDPAARRGSIRQSANPYSIDAVLRIVHTLLLAKQGGFLLHSASAVRNGKAFLFAGVSGAGKTTISRLAPPDATLLTDEISYVRKLDGSADASGKAGYAAYGTPFTREWAEQMCIRDRYQTREIAVARDEFASGRRFARTRIFLLSPANASGVKGQRLLAQNSESEFVQRLRLSLIHI